MTDPTQGDTVQLRRGTAQLWAIHNPVLLDGEEGYETDTGRRKVGNGFLPYLDLSYDQDVTNVVDLLARFPETLDLAGTGAAAATVGALTTSYAPQSGATLQGALQLPGVARGGVLQPYGAGQPTSTNPGITGLLEQVNTPHAVHPSPALEFDVITTTAATTIGINLFATTAAAGNPRAQVWVAGQLVSDTTLSAAAGTFVVLPISMAAVGSVRVRVKLQACQFAGIYLNPQRSTVVAVSDRRLKLATLGDSWTEGALGVQEMDLWAVHLAHLLGADLARMGQGGSGYVANWAANSAPNFGTPERMARLAQAAPDLIIVQGSQNDDNAGGAAIGAAAADVYAQIGAALPHATLVVVGPPRINAAPSPARLANRDAVAAAAAAAPNVLGFIDQLGVSALQANAAPLLTAGSTYQAGAIVRDATGTYYQAATTHVAGSGGALDYGFVTLPWMTGNGTADAPVADGGNSSVLVGTDSAHPTAAGHAFLARRIYSELTRLLAAH